MIHTSSRSEIFDNALQEHSGAILHYLYSLCKDWALAEDLSQNFWRAVHKYFSEEEMQQSGLLYYKAKQVFIDHYRATKARVGLYFLDEVPEPMLMPRSEEPESIEDDQRLYEQFWEMFYPDQYDEISKRIFWLHVRYGYKMEEVGEMVGLPSSTAHDRLKRLKAACLKRLEQQN